MQDDNPEERKELIDILCAEVARLLCADDVSEEEKLKRINLAQAIIDGSAW